LAVLGVIAAVVYFGYVRESEARALRRCRSLTCQPCVPADCLALGPQAGPPSGGVTVPGTGLPPSGVTGGAARPPQPTPRPPGKLHALLLVDDANKDTGVPNKAGAALLEKLLREGIPAQRLGTVVTLAGDAVTPDSVRARLAELNVGSDDTLVAYYAGAAIYNENTRSYLLTPAAAAGTSLPRSELRTELLLQKARLTVLLTDTPATTALPDMVQPLPALEGPFRLDGLLLRHRGIVDLHASAANESAFTRGNEGGLFTLALARELAKAKADTTWPALVDTVRAETDRLYKEFRRDVLRSDRIPDAVKRAYREQTAQTPTALTPLDQVGPVPPGSESPAPEAGQPADLVVYLPEGVRLFIEDRPTRQTTAERRFETPPLEPGRVYTYTLRAEQPGAAAAETKRVQVRAGEVVAVRFGAAAEVKK
jgi:uncharacterized protein (TIGR03000 family)